MSPLDPSPALPRRRWQLTGALMLAHVVLMLAGFTVTPVSRLGDSPAEAVAAYRSGSAGAAAVGSAVALLGFVAFLAAALLLAQLLRSGTESGRWPAALISASGAVYVGITLGLGFAGSGAARFGARHGMPATTVAALSSLHWFGVFTATAVLGVFTVAVAVAALLTQRLPRWPAALGVVPGVFCLVAALNPPEDVVDDATLVWMVWFVVLAIAALRTARRSRRSLAVPAAA